MLHESIAAELPEMRRRAEELMVDTCVVRYATGLTEQDPDTGAEVPVYADRFTSKCKVQARTLVVRDAEVGGRTSSTVRLELHLPVGSPAVETGDVAEIVGVGALSDLQLLGRRFTIAAPVAKTYATARRYEVEEVVA